MVIGKGGETIRSLEAEYEVQIDIEEDGTILVYATEGTKGDAAIEAIRNLTKEPEVGDTYTGRVVKTTDFGAFVELKKGTDGLLHVSNVGPGRVNHIEDVIARGDILDVVVQEVDKARGRIGLKLVQKHEGDTMVSPEELIERAKDAPPREPREDRGPRRDGARGGSRGPRREREGSRSEYSKGRRHASRPPRSPTAWSSSASCARTTAPSFFRRWATSSSTPGSTCRRDRGTPTSTSLLRAVREGRSDGRPHRLRGHGGRADIALGAVIASRRARDNYEVAYLAGAAGRGQRTDDARRPAALRLAVPRRSRPPRAADASRRTSRRRGSPSVRASSARAWSAGRSGCTAAGRTRSSGRCSRTTRGDRPFAAQPHTGSDPDQARARPAAPPRGRLAGAPRTGSLLAFVSGMIGITFLLFNDPRARFHAGPRGAGRRCRQMPRWRRSGARRSRRRSRAPPA